MIVNGLKRKKNKMDKTEIERAEFEELKESTTAMVAEIDRLTALGDKLSDVVIEEYFPFLQGIVEWQETAYDLPMKDIIVKNRYYTEKLKEIK